MAVPNRLFHGTNPVLAAAIISSGRLQADEPVDDAGLGPVVCTTSNRSMARKFATEFARLNSPYDVGVVFEIDSRRIPSRVPVVPHSADSASEDEQEYRIQGDVPMHAVVAVRIVGRAARLNLNAFLQKLWGDAIENGFSRHFSGEAAFRRAMDRLLKTAH